jgi:ankyrin repeat domain-containing protein 42
LIILDLAFPAHIAAYNGDLEHIKLLIEQGVVNINERDERGATLAHKAAGQGHLHILQWLIEMGASMELTTQSGETAKDVARRFSQLACLKMLGGGADKSETNQRQQNESTTQGNRKKLTPKEEERQRARTKLDELEKQIDIAKKNYRQLGGHLEDDQQRETIEQDTQKYYFNKYKLK